MLGLPPRAQSQEQSQLFGRWVGARKRKPPERGGKRRKSRRELASSEEKRGTGNISEHNKKANGDNETKKRGGGGLFDVSVLCTAYRDLNVLFDFHGGVDPRLAGAFLWNVTVSRGSFLRIPLSGSHTEILFCGHLSFDIGRNIVGRSLSDLSAENMTT